ncbi:uncharacterized protein TRUGW13939_09147 [Talaromyces rugulosus]|uniref:FAD-binding domain-containing protein n=1 Tax=Talaromyces rugulosus TaxID=121627 RepID=A0A7H8R8A2_TALRU|nr:uncharacterized protein TRUGW13939_09147 [Talaromyces rugulosus]QKX61991.1 hypothetical protein TRUGW13939_09147 [Talaromyces rugulosus]
MAETVVDRVARHPALNLKVIIVGAGVGGLLSALECWRKGCDVVVLEKNKDISLLGDFVTVPPSGISTFKLYPTMDEQYQKNFYDCTISIWNPEGKCLKRMFPEWRHVAEKGELPRASLLSRRSDFTRMLYDQCIRLGIPVYFSQAVQEIVEHDDHVVINTNQPGITLTADVCVVANGIGYPSTKDITGIDLPVLDSGYAIARMAFPRSSIPKGSLAHQLVENVDTQPEFRVYLSNDIHLIIWLTKDSGDGKAIESWHNLRESAVLVDQLEQKCSSWDPAVIDFMRRIPGQVVDWGLRSRDPVEQWTSAGGRIVMLGDAAHTFLPTAGNGAVQACEDAISIAECLRQGGKQGAPWSTRVYNKLRFERTSILQQTGFTNREELHYANLDEIARNPEISDIGFFKIGRWVWAHKPEAYAIENYQKCLDYLQTNGSSEFRNTNVPPGHVYRPWSMESEHARMTAGIRSDLKSNGDWSV